MQEDKICTQSLDHLFDKCKAIYGQDDPNKFYISSKNVFGYHIGSIQRQSLANPRVFTVLNYAIPADRQYIKHNNTKCFNCDMCTIVHPDGVLNIHKTPVARETTKENIANKFCIFLDTDGKHILEPVVISASDDQYLYGHALLTTSEHIANHFTFVYPGIYISIFNILRKLHEQYPGVTAYFNGRLGSSVQHSHVHLSHTRSFIAKYCCNTLQKSSFITHPVNYKGIKGFLLCFSHDMLLSDSVKHIMQGTIIKNIVMNDNPDNALIAHMFTDATHYYVLFMMVKDKSIRGCQVTLDGGKNVSVGLIPAVNLISVLGQPEDVLVSLLTKDRAGKIPIQECLDGFNKNYKEPDEIIPYSTSVSFEEQDKLFQDLYSAAATRFFIPVNTKGTPDVWLLQNVFNNIDRFFFILYVSKDLDKQSFYQTLFQMLKRNNKLLEKEFTPVMNIVITEVFLRYNLHDDIDLLRSSIVHLIGSFANNLIMPSLKDGTCYALKGEYLQPRLEAVMQILSEKGNLTKHLRPALAAGAYGSVHPSSNVFDNLHFPGLGKANVIIKKQNLVSTINRYSVEHELEVGKLVNPLRKYIPNFMLTYGGVMEAKHGYIFVEDLSGGETIASYIQSPQFSWKELFNITGSLLAGLMMAKQKNGFTHFDLHTSNVLLLPLSLCAQSKPGNVGFDYHVGKGMQVKVTLSRLPVAIDYGMAYVHGASNFLDPGLPSFTNDFSYAADMHSLLSSILLVLTETSRSGYLVGEEGEYRALWYYVYCIYASALSGHPKCDLTTVMSKISKGNIEGTFRGFLGAFFDNMKADGKQVYWQPNPIVVDTWREPLKSNWRKMKKDDTFYWEMLDVFKQTFDRRVAVGDKDIPSTFLEIAGDTIYDKADFKDQPGNFSAKLAQMLQQYSEATF